MGVVGQDRRRAVGRRGHEKVAAASMASEARLLRNHPSVIGFLIGSDNAPPPAISKMYVDTLHAEPTGRCRSSRRLSPKATA